MTLIKLELTYAEEQLVIKALQSSANELRMLANGRKVEEQEALLGVAKKFEELKERVQDAIAKQNT